MNNNKRHFNVEYLKPSGGWAIAEYFCSEIKMGEAGAVAVFRINKHGISVLSHVFPVGSVVKELESTET